MPPVFSVSDLMKIASAGGGMTLDLNKEHSFLTLQNIHDIAASASQLSARVVVRGGMKMATVSDYVKIALAGRGCVSFED